MNNGKVALREELWICSRAKDLTPHSVTRLFKLWLRHSRCGSSSKILAFTEQKKALALVRLMILCTLVHSIRCRCFQGLVPYLRPA